MTSSFSTLSQFGENIKAILTMLHQDPYPDVHSRAAAEARWSDYFRGSVPAVMRLTLLFPSLYTRTCGRSIEYPVPFPTLAPELLPLLKGYCEPH